MKKTLIVLLLTGLTLGSFAQPKIGGGFRGGGIHGGFYTRPNVTVIAPYAPYYGLGFGLGYSPFYSPFYRYPRMVRPSQIDLQIEDIKNDYKYQISTVRHDKSMTGHERRQKIRELKHEREDAIIEARKNYFEQRYNNRAS